MKRKDIAIDPSTTDVEELQQMVESLVHLIDDAETRVNEIASLLDIKRIDDLSDIYQAYENVQELGSDLY